MADFKKAIRNITPEWIQIARRNIISGRRKEKNLSQSRKEFNKLLQSGTPLWLELGAGMRKGKNGWTTVDISKGCDIIWDLSQKLPLPDNSVEKIYSSHFLEHFDTPEIKNILAESYRLLKPGGWISACVPNARIYIDAYIKGEPLDADAYFQYKPAFHYNSSMDYVNHIAYMAGEHKHMFDEENLVAIFRNCGFKNAQPRKFIEGLDLAERKHQSLYVEASK